MSINATDDHEAGFVSRVRVIEEQPLASRASGYSSLLDELARKLDAPVSRIASESSE